MDEGFREHALEWFERGAHDLEAARLILDQRGHTDVAAHLIHQAPRQNSWVDYAERLP